MSAKITITSDLLKPLYGAASYPLTPTNDAAAMAEAEHALARAAADQHDLRLGEHLTYGIYVQTENGESIPAPVYYGIAKDMHGFVDPVRDPDVFAHLERHLQRPIDGSGDGHLTIGSKLPDDLSVQDIDDWFYDQLATWGRENPPDAALTMLEQERQAAVARRIQETRGDARGYATQIGHALAVSYYYLVQQAKQTRVPPGRIVLEGKLDKPGVDPLVEIKPGQGYINLVRDAGTPNESVIKVIPVESMGAMPKTHDVQIIAGPYGNTGKWGFYTILVGGYAPSMPNDRQEPEERASSETFWNGHGFLATPEQIAFTLKQMKEVLESQPEKNATYAPMIQTAENVIAKWAAFDDMEALSKSQATLSFLELVQTAYNLVPGTISPAIRFAAAEELIKHYETLKACRKDLLIEEQSNRKHWSTCLVKENALAVDGFSHKQVEALERHRFMQEQYNLLCENSPNTVNVTKSLKKSKRALELAFSRSTPEDREAAQTRYNAAYSQRKEAAAAAIRLKMERFDALCKRALTLHTRFGSDKLRAKADEWISYDLVLGSHVPLERTLHFIKGARQVINAKNGQTTKPRHWDSLSSLRGEALAEHVLGKVRGSAQPYLVDATARTVTSSTPDIGGAANSESDLNCERPHKGHGGLAGAVAQNMRM